MLTTGLIDSRNLFVLDDDPADAYRVYDPLMVSLHKWVGID
ncbi:MAG: hypothetical protein R3C05_17260 [Pirellulaceae bacterium]